MLKTWLQAIRPRTLFLSSAPILAGASIAISQDRFDGLTLTLALCTSLLLQIISNLANDLGDFTKGTDDEGRIGPERALQSGRLSANTMKVAVVLVSLLALASGIVLLTYSLDNWEEFLAFFGVGLLAIAAAWGYTMGKNAYGYLGLGDLSVLIFFGLAGTLGSSYLFTQTIPTSALFAAIAIGSMAVLVLNLNNMRDAENDKLHGKQTLALRLGSFSKVYHLCVAALAIGGLVGYQMLAALELWWILPGVVFLAVDTFIVLRTKDPAKLDPHLAVIGMGTFLTSILMFVGQLLSNG